MRERDSFAVLMNAASREGRMMVLSKKSAQGKLLLSGPQMESVELSDWASTTSCCYCVVSIFLMFLTAAVAALLGLLPMDSVARDVRAGLTISAGEGLLLGGSLLSCRRATAIRSTWRAQTPRRVRRARHRLAITIVRQHFT